MTIKPFLLPVVLFCSVHLFAQKKARIELVDASHKIKGEPYIILPKAAVRIKVNVVEFGYSIGDSLRKYIRIDPGCDKKIVKAALAPLVKEYDINADIIDSLLRRPKADDEKELKIYKMDKEVKMSVLSVLDPSKIYKYIKLNSALNSGLLTLEYDENGILVSSKQTDEPKLIPTIFSAITGLAGIASATKGTGSTSVSKANDTSGCVKIQHVMETALDDAIMAYNSYLTSSVSIFTEKQFEKGREKKEEAMNKLLSSLFYSKTTKIIPMEMIYIIPDTVPTGSNDEYPLFALDKTNGKLQYASGNATSHLLTPIDRFTGVANLTDSVILKLSDVPVGFNKAAMLSSFVEKPEKLTVVYNLPKSMRLELRKARSTESYLDTVVKLPQRGTIGYFSMRPSNLELTYDNNGELRKITAERKSVLDQTAGGFTAAKDFITANKKTEKTELELLKERLDLLDTLKKIRDLENEPN